MLWFCVAYTLAHIPRPIPSTVHVFSTHIHGIVLIGDQVFLRYIINPKLCGSHTSLCTLMYIEGARTNDDLHKACGIERQRSRFYPPPPQKNGEILPILHAHAAMYKILKPIL